MKYVVQKEIRIQRVIEAETQAKAILAGMEMEGGRVIVTAYPKEDEADEAW